MRPAFWFGLTAGACLFAGLLLYQGAGGVLSAVALAGWGLLLVALAHIAVLASNAMSWQMLLRHGDRQPFLRLARMWWIGSSVNALLPVAQVGGDLVRARLLARCGVPGARAGATVVVGLTASVLTLLLFAAAGALLLGADLRGTDQGEALRILAGLGVFGTLLLGFYVAQRSGLFFRMAQILERLASGRDWLALIGGAQALDRAILALYQDRRAFLACCAWRLVAWVGGVAEVWLALSFLGHPVSFATAFVLESLGQAVRSAGFAIPGALGVQEGGFLLLGLLLGVPGEAALGVSLVKRVRDLALGLPGLAAWHLIEGGSVFSRRGGGE